MPKSAVIMLTSLVLLGTALIVFPLLPSRDRSQSVDANIKECRGLTKRNEAITYGTYIDQPPGEILFTDGGSISRKMSQGYKAACTSGKPMRLSYAPVKGSIEAKYLLRGIRSVDGTDYFSVADSIAADREDNYYAIPVGLGLYFLAFIGYRGAKKKATDEAAAAAAARAARKR
jgi:hypothetical protein